MQNRVKLALDVTEATADPSLRFSPGNACGDGAIAMTIFAGYVIGTWWSDHSKQRPAILIPSGKTLRPRRS